MKSKNPKKKEKSRNPKKIAKILEEYWHKNPLPTINIIITIILAITMIVITLYYNSQNIRLQNENNLLQKQNIELQNEKANLEKPFLFAEDIEVEGGSSLKIDATLKNPSRSIDYYYQSGECIPDPELLSNLEISTVQNILTNKTEDKKIPAGDELEVSCSFDRVKNPPSDKITYVKMCVNIARIADPLCRVIQVFIKNLR